MSTQASVWPKGVFASDQPKAVKTATRHGKTKIQPLTLQSTFANVPVILFTTVFAAEVAAVVAGVGLILASLGALFLHSVQ